MSNVSLIPPLQEEDIRKLRIGDSVHVTGIVYGIRDATQIRIFDEGVKPPVDLSGSVCLHTAPNVKKIGDRYYPVCVGTTTSTRMERFTPGLLEHYGVRAIVGKGGLLDESVRAMRKFGGCYLAIVGGLQLSKQLKSKRSRKFTGKTLCPNVFGSFASKTSVPSLLQSILMGGISTRRLKMRPEKKCKDCCRNSQGPKARTNLKTNRKRTFIGVAKKGLG